MYAKIIKLINLFSFKFKLLAIIILLFTTLTMLLEMVSISLIVPLTSTILDNFNSENKSLINSVVYFLFESLGFNDLFTFCLILFAVFFIFRVLLNLILQIANIYFSFKVYQHLTSEVLKIYLNHEWSFFIKKNTAEIMRDILSETGIFRSSIILPLMTLISEFIILFGILTLLLIYDTKFTLLCLLIFLFVGIIYRLLFKKKLNELANNRQLYSTKVNKNILETFKLIKEVKLSFKENFFYDVFYKNNSNYIKTNFFYNFISLIPRYFFELLILLVFSVLLFFKNINETNMSVIIPSLSLYFLAALRVMPSVVKILRSFQSIDWGANSVDVLYNLIKSSNYKKSIGHSKNIKKMSFENKIEIKDLSFSFEKKDIIKNFNQEIIKNEFSGIVGKSGSGKTTLINILMGFLYPSKGKILVDNKDILEDLNGWRKNIFLVQQENIILDDTIKNNITFNLEENKVDQEKYIMAIKNSNLENYINQLPDKDNTITGENGIQISGGQKQRLSIARALYHDPDVLILDEATSSLDLQTESEILNFLSVIKGQKTIFIISHRESSLKLCDKIIRL